MVIKLKFTKENLNMFYLFPRRDLEAETACSSPLHIQNPIAKQFDFGAGSATQAKVGSKALAAFTNVDSLNHSINIYNFTKK